MTKKLDTKRFKAQKELGFDKTNVCMNRGHKWMIEEIAYLERRTQKDVLYEILQDYWDNITVKSE